MRVLRQDNEQDSDIQLPYPVLLIMRQEGMACQDCKWTYLSEEMKGFTGG